MHVGVGANFSIKFQVLFVVHIESKLVEASDIIRSNTLKLTLFNICCHIFTNFILSNYAHLNRGTVNLVNMCSTYQPGIVGT